MNRCSDESANGKIELAIGLNPPNCNVSVALSTFEPPEHADPVQLHASCHGAVPRRRLVTAKHQSFRISGGNFGIKQVDYRVPKRFLWEGSMFFIGHDITHNSVVRLVIKYCCELHTE